MNCTRLAGYAMTRFALETVSTNGWQVVAACSHAAAFLQRHPEFDDQRRC